jgi:1,4-dihydroxy-6-naphthoate synthase
VPGENTTAALLLKLWNTAGSELVPVRFDKIMKLVAAGEFDAGLIIHEGRFVYGDYGLVKIADLGEWWETYTGLPIPLGVIAARSDRFSCEETVHISGMVSASIEYADKNPAASAAYIRSFAQELDPAVIQQHISLYVNSFSADMGEAGLNALETLESEALKKGLL